MYSSPRKSFLVKMLDSPERCIEWQELPKIAPAEEAELAPVPVFGVPGSRGGLRSNKLRESSSHQPQGASGLLISN